MAWFTSFTFRLPIRLCFVFTASGTHHIPISKLLTRLLASRYVSGFDNIVTANYGNYIVLSGSRPCCSAHLLLVLCSAAIYGWGCILNWERHPRMFQTYDAAYIASFRQLLWCFPSTWKFYLYHVVSCPRFAQGYRLVLVVIVYKHACPINSDDITGALCPYQEKLRHRLGAHTY